ncbi:MAG: AhpC/TSA family protein [Prevotella sp.]|nr:AhpC/TSA family protein [Prevotella sp.]
MMKRKCIMLAVALMAIISATAQVKFTVKGKALEHADTVMVGNMSTSKVIDNGIVAVKDGMFTVTGNVAENSMLCVIDRVNRVQTYFIVDGPDITLDMTNDAVSGTPLNEKFTKFIQQLNKIQEKQMQVMQEAHNNTDNNKIEYYEEQKKAAANEEKDCLRKAIADNQDNCIAAFALQELMYDIDYEELKGYVESNAPYLDNAMCRGAKQRLKSLELRAPGRMFIDLVENDVDGNPHHLSEYVGKGNYVLVDFWASWCGPCMGEMPNVKECYEKYKDKGFNVVGLSFDRSKEAWVECIKKNGLNWVNLSDLKYWKTIAADTYGINSIPSNILCDGTGKIVASDLRAESLKNKLKEIYGF